MTCPDLRDGRCTRWQIPNARGQWCALCEDARYRELWRQGRGPGQQFVSEGLGDTVAKITRATRLDCAAYGLARAVGKTDCGCARRRKMLNKLVPYRRRRSMRKWVRLADLHADTAALAGQLPPDIDAVVGMARSGLIPASIVAASLHLPLYSYSRDGLIDLGYGTRLRQGSPNQRRHVLFLDDTAHTGATMAACAPIVQERFGGARLTRAVIYATPNARRAVDLYAVLLGRPHWLEWHFFNSPFVSQTAFDFDGIFCEDPTLPEASDERKYRHFLSTARPKHLVRFAPVPLVVTSRLERYRPETVRWLDRHGMRVKHLIMGPWKTASERNRPGEAAFFKGQHYRAAAGLRLFVESDRLQAYSIAEVSKKTVICPRTGEVF